MDGRWLSLPCGYVRYEGEWVHVLVNLGKFKGRTRISPKAARTHGVTHSSCSLENS